MLRWIILNLMFCLAGAAWAADASASADGRCEKSCPKASTCAKARMKPRIADVRRIWNAAPHNAFTDLIRYKDRLFCTFREAEHHNAHEGGIRVITSKDGKEWESAALLTEPGIDLRDPKLSVTPDGRLMLLGGLRIWPLDRRELSSWVSFSTDGRQWTPRQTVCEDGHWLWRVTWHKNVAYGIAYGESRNEGGGNPSWTSKLCRAPDGIHYQEWAVFDEYEGMTEATVRFGPDDRAYCIHRRDKGTKTALLGTSEPPYKQWTWLDTGVHLGGPTLIHHKGQWWAAGRWLVGPAKTVLAKVDFEAGTLERVLEFPSGGDTSYPAFVVDGDDLLMSYYASHEDKTSIYLARIAFEAGCGSAANKPTE